jgi:glycine/D-amino acid oxidase-like deaminating enzyme
MAIHSKLVSVKTGEVQSQTSGAKVFEDSGVTHLKIGECVRIETEHGLIIADKVILTNGVPLPFGNWRPQINRKRVFAVTADLAENGQVPYANYFDTETPLNFYRPIGKYEILFGGADTATDAPPGSQRSRVMASETYLQNVFPGAKITRSWSGVINETEDGLPYIGPHPEFPGKVYVASGFGGTGFVWSGISSLILPKMLHTSSDYWSELFSLSRQTDYRSICRVS